MYSYFYAIILLIIFHF